MFVYLLDVVGRCWFCGCFCWTQVIFCWKGAFPTPVQQNQQPYPHRPTRLIL
ncbi:TPA_asm: hypothetical protein [Porphyromonas phage phage024a_F0570]|uniref:Uncharacterized protein n=1 Tax=Porphyromonas phage phage024a_F0570 TaxID=3154114 RepID=A0AAT9JDG6_9CAUD